MSGPSKHTTADSGEELRTSPRRLDIPASADYNPAMFEPSPGLTKAEPGGILRNPPSSKSPASAGTVAGCKEGR